ncbi:HAMP domain-containing protein [Trinickia violacea]|uniref:HAMP domain-containing protein n=1 Tax=Trinickia violacea TaxID=2571746 RepID=A0A4P8IXX6_9BURK|nr:histidine kinase [Trinickia violacea]QCP53391.1 HAMP domain-containing protein [Trinickia violacea]
MRLPFQSMLWPPGLHTKLMLSLLVLITVVAGTSTYRLMNHERERRMNVLEERATRIADLLSRSLAQPLWNVDRAAIDEQLAALAPNPEVVQFTVTAANYGVVSSIKKRADVAPEEGVVRVRPIEYDPPGDAPREKIGEVRIVLTRAVALRDIDHARRTVLETLALALIVLYGATFLLVRHVVRKPIARLEEMVDRIAGGDLDARCTVESGDELGRLAARVNVMAERLLLRAAHQEAIREEERKHIAMAIHDELGQLLTAVKMDVSLMKLTLGPDAPGREKADEIGELVERTIQIVRNVASHLRPAALNYGLASALEWLADDFNRHSPIECRFQMLGAEPVLSETRATAIFRIVQEALTNVARHAGASHVDVTLNNLDTDLELIVRDDGRGFDVRAARQGYSYGLLGMTERARMADAELRIESTQNAGSVIRVLIRNDEPVLP